jgi:hypothetical protein
MYCDWIAGESGDDTDISPPGAYDDMILPVDDLKGASSAIAGSCFEQGRPRLRSFRDESSATAQVAAGQNSTTLPRVAAG